MRRYKEIKDNAPGKLVTSSGYFDDISHSLLCAGAASGIASKYTLQQRRPKYQSLFQDSSYPLATDKAKYKPVKINPRFCYKPKN